MGTLTVLMGANDVGKSRLVTDVVRRLSGLEPELGSWTVFAEPSLQSSNVSERILDPPTPGRRLFTTPMTVGELAAAREVREWLHDHPLLAFSAATGTRVLNVASAIPCDARTPPAVRRAFDRMRSRKGAVPDLAPPEVVDHLGVTGISGLPRPLSVPTSHETVVAELAPAITDFLRFLEVVRNDYPLDLVGHTKDSSHDTDDEDDSGWHSHVTTLLENAARELTTLESLADAWVDVDKSGTSAIVTAEAVHACTFISRRATRHLPKFIADRYTILVRPRAFPYFSADRPVEVFLCDRKTNRSFELGSAAGGLQLWTQLALLEAAARLRVFHSKLAVTLLLVRTALSTLNDARTRAGEATWHLSEENDDRPTSLDEIEQSAAQLTVAEDAVALAEEALVDATKDFEGHLFEFNGDWAAALAEDDDVWPVYGPFFTNTEELDPIASSELRHLRPLLYVLDEPERHLHPRLHREAANWIEQLVATTGSQAIVVTHSPAFLNLGANTLYAQVRRSADGSAQIFPFESESQTALSEFASELGFDRGQLLALTNAILFVEGRDDQRLFEALFRLRFARAGIVVVPISGVVRHGSVIDSDVFLRYVLCPAAVVFDSVTEEELARLRTDRDYRSGARRARAELSAMAQLIENAERSHRDIEPFPLPYRDIFDAVDESVIRGLYPTFPGHDAAAVSWEQQRSKHPEVKFKQYCYDTYKVPAGDPAFYASAGDIMAERNLIPPGLDRVVFELERLALAGGTR